MSDILTISMTALKNIALENSNFGSVDMQMKIYMLKKWIRFSVRKDEKLAALVNDVRENWRRIKNFYYQDREEFPDLTRALHIFGKMEKSG